MGKNLIILLVGFSASMGVLAISKNQRLVDSYDRAYDQVSRTSVNNASASGAYMGLSRLYRGLSADFTDRVINGDTVTVVVEDNGIDSTIAVNQMRITSTGRHGIFTEQTQVMIYDGSFDEFAVWAKDTVINVTTKEPDDDPNPALLIQDAPYMPKINYDGLISEAATQLHSQIGSPWEPADNYPNGSFYHLLGAPNVTHVDGDLKVNSGVTIYGIFIVEGNAILDGNSLVRGILYLPNAGSTVGNGGGDVADANVRGGILTWGSIDGTSRLVSVRQETSYLDALVDDFVPENPPIRVLSWR